MKYEITESKYERYLRNLIFEKSCLAEYYLIGCEQSKIKIRIEFLKELERDVVFYIYYHTCKYNQFLNIYLTDHPIKLEPVIMLAGETKKEVKIKQKKGKITTIIINPNIMCPGDVFTYSLLCKERKKNK